jgi:hypothetical protein
VSEIARRWIVANVIGSIVICATSLLDYAFRKWLGAGSAETGSPTAIRVIASVLLTTPAFVLYAWLTGRVLRQIVPALSMRAWMALNLVIALVLGIGFEILFADQPETADQSEPINWSELGLLFIPVALVLGAVVGALLGAVSGSLQALVLRRAAGGTGSWIAFSSLASAVAFMLLAAAFLFLTADGTAVHDDAIQAAAAVTLFVPAFVMLPALRRLRPRTA